MADEPTVDLSLIARQQRQVIDEIGSMRHDMVVMMAILQRKDGMLATLLPEIQAIHSQHSRPASRVRGLEERTN